MSGFQEILLIVIIVLAIFFIPRMTARNAPPAAAHPVVRRRPTPLGGRLRLAILISVVWLCCALLFFRPWEGDWIRFGAMGALPLVITWGLYWVFAGFQARSGRTRPGRIRPQDKRR